MRRGRQGWPRIVTPWGRYTRQRILFWRVRIPLWLAGAAAGWLAGGIWSASAWGRVACAAGGLAIAGLAEAAFCYRQERPRRALPRPSREQIAALRAGRLLREDGWETRAVPSPGGWLAPAGSRPAWNWTPPDGLRWRRDRVPAWVRFWYRIPFVDRYACAWMWYHGGWDVIPPVAGPATGD